MGVMAVWILGGYQSDFAHNLTREGRDYADLTAEVVGQTLAAAGVDAADVSVVHVGNAFGELFAGQGHLGAMPATVHDGLWDTPATRHEAACASGSVATLAAIADLRSGAYGGLIGGGHPVGASGVRMLLDAAKQVSGSAGDYQVGGAQNFGTLNIGGSTSTTVSFVVGAVDGW
jgi:acetyl-CoA acetyltransferase